VVSDFTLNAVLGLFPFVFLIWIATLVVAFRRENFWSHLALQISALMFVLWFLAYFNFAIAASMAAMPPIAIVLIADRIIAGSPQFVLVLFAAAMPFGLAGFIVCARIPVLRKWTVSIVSMSFFLAGFAIAEVFTTRAMCNAAETFGISQFDRRNSFWSFKEFSDEEYPRYPHAAASVSGKHYLWSYYDLNWYELTGDNIFGLNGSGYSVSCSH
jgi:hypothetical protein